MRPDKIGQDKDEQQPPLRCGKSLKLSALSDPFVFTDCKMKSLGLEAECSKQNMRVKEQTRNTESRLKSYLVKDQGLFLNIMQDISTSDR